MKLYIRTEANKITATGHMMRCLAIADAARELGVETLFIVAEEDSASLPKQKGYETLCLGRTWNDFDGEIPIMEALIQQYNIQMLLVDHYYVSKEYMAAIGKKTKTAYIDDLHDGVWPCSVIINYAVYSDLFDYEKEYPVARRLLGCNYAPLRAEYSEAYSKTVREKVENVLVVTGGTDEFHFMKQFYEMIAEAEEWKEISFLLVCGAYNGDYAELAQKKSTWNNVKVCDALPGLKPAMEKADLIVTAGGTTLYEVAAMRLPGICFCIADNQIRNVEGFVSGGYLLDGGDVRSDFSMEELRKKLAYCVDNFNVREEMAKRLGSLVDGNGARRIANALLEEIK